MRKIVLLFCLCLFLSGASDAQKRRVPPRESGTKPMHTPRIGSRERTAILDALRVPIENGIGKPILFQPAQFNVRGDWAFATGTFIGKDGKPFSFKGTKWEKTAEEGAMDNSFSGLLQRVRGKWLVVDSDWGATDVSWIPWIKKHKAPTAIYPAYGGSTAL